MTVRNAEEASEIVKEFLSKMGWSIFIFPRKAEKVDHRWIVEIVVGVKKMEFELDEEGQILRYKTLD